MSLATQSSASPGQLVEPNLLRCFWPPLLNLVDVDLKLRLMLCHWPPRAQHPQGKKGKAKPKPKASGSKERLQESKAKCKAQAKALKEQSKELTDLRRSLRNHRHRKPDSEYSEEYNEIVNSSKTSKNDNH